MIDAISFFADLGSIAAGIFICCMGWGLWNGRGWRGSTRLDRIKAVPILLVGHSLIAIGMFCQLAGVGPLEFLRNLWLGI